MASRKSTKLSVPWPPKMHDATGMLAKLAGGILVQPESHLVSSKFRYTYDFGDDWEHDILVERILPFEEGMPYLIYLGGKRPCPPEDVGGPWGYREYLEAIRDPNQARHAEMLEWGGEFDPEAMDS